MKWEKNQNYTMEKRSDIIVKGILYHIVLLFLATFISFLFTIVLENVFKKIITENRYSLLYLSVSFFTFIVSVITGYGRKDYIIMHTINYWWTFFMYFVIYFFILWYNSLNFFNNISGFKFWFFYLINPCVIGAGIYIGENFTKKNLFKTFLKN